MGSCSHGHACFHCRAVTVWAHVLQIWMNYIMPRFFGWKSIFSGRPKLQSLYDAMQKEPAGQKVISISVPYIPGMQVSSSNSNQVKKVKNIFLGTCCSKMMDGKCF